MVDAARQRPWHMISVSGFPRVSDLEGDHRLLEPGCTRRR